LFRREVSHVATLQTILLLPAAVFMAALGLRAIPMFERSAQGVVMAYAARVWTLWVLLLAFPLCVAAAGSLTLLSNRVEAGAEASRVVAAVTAAAFAILAIVVVHMLAN
jgi:hypothetical protein